MRKFWVFLIAMCGLHLSVLAAADAARFALTADTLQKIRLAQADVEKQGASQRSEDDEDDEDDGDDDETVEDVARRIDGDPRLKAALARHGLTSMSFAMSVHAILHASTYLMFEKSLDKQKAAALYAGYTPEQRANIELLRKTGGRPR